MFRWPDPPDGQIIVRLPFEIYWAASLSVTLILGFGMYILTVREELDKWLRTVSEKLNEWLRAVSEKPNEWLWTVAAILLVGAGKLSALGVKKTPVDGSHHEKPKQDSSCKGNAATTKSSNDAASVANAQLPHAVPEETMAGNSQSAESKTVVNSDVEAAVDGIDTANQKGRLSRCTVM
jgi:hypothetical protein